MTKKKLILFGGGQLAELASFYFQHDSEFQVEAFTVDDDFVKEEYFLGKPVIPVSEVQLYYPPSEFDAFVAISYKKLNLIRTKAVSQLKQKGYTLQSYISSKATVWPGFQAGENCFVLEDNTIQPFAVLGNNVTLWSGNHIGHHSTIKDNVFITSHVVISGNVVVEEGSFIGVNATVSNSVTVGDHSVIAAGAVVMKDTVPGSVIKTATGELAEYPSSVLVERGKL